MTEAGEARGHHEVAPAATHMIHVVLATYSLTPHHPAVTKAAAVSSKRFCIRSGVL